jgi:hypothetical protein
MRMHSLLKSALSDRKKQTHQRASNINFPEVVQFSREIFSVIAAAAVWPLANIYSVHYLLILFLDQQTVSLARVLPEIYI